MFAWLRRQLCEMGCHNWERWTKTTKRFVKKEQITDKVIEDTTTGYVMERSCRVCNAFERKVILISAEDAS